MGEDIANFTELAYLIRLLPRITFLYVLPDILKFKTGFAQNESGLGAERLFIFILISCKKKKKKEKERSIQKHSRVSFSSTNMAFSAERETYTKLAKS